VRIRAIDRVSSGSPGSYRLNPEPGFFRTVDAARALARRGVTLSLAKRVVERMMEGRAADLDVPLVEDRDLFARDLAELGVNIEDQPTPAGAERARPRHRPPLGQEPFARALEP